MKFVLPVAFLVGASLLGAGSAMAAPVSKTATATAQILLPLSVINSRSLDFGLLSANSAGTATIDPTTDVLTTTGGIVQAGGAPISAKFTGTAGGLNLVFIRVPTSVTLTRVGGTETMLVNQWVIEGGAFRLFTARTAFDFRVGAKLNVSATQFPGTYSGTYNVDVIYF